jgi:hypothetical protein
MNSRRRFTVRSRLAASALACLGLLACQSQGERPPSQLEWYLTTYDYCEFQRPRADCGAGSVISFDALGEEQLLAPPADVLGALKVRPRKLDAGPLATQERIEEATARELALACAYAPDVDLAAALELQGIDAIRVTLLDPFQERVPAGTMAERVGGVGSTSSIGRAVLQAESLVLWNVLGVEGVAYEFLDANGYPLPIPAALAKAIRVPPEMVERAVGARRLEFHGRMLIGYRAWRARAVVGDSAVSVEWLEQRPQDVRAMRRSSMQPASPAGAPRAVSKP